MIQTKVDYYLRTAGGWYVATSLSVPNPWGEWCLVAVLTNPRVRLRTEPALTIVPQRAMGNEEVASILSRPLMFWGMKVPEAPWALIMCRAQTGGGTLVAPTQGTYDPLRGIGV